MYQCETGVRRAYAGLLYSMREVLQVFAGFRFATGDHCESFFKRVKVIRVVGKRVAFRFIARRLGIFLRYLNNPRLETTTLKKLF